ncbi:FKBP-type peptidyl-prolyl cis-trans isomerase [Blastococcus sp. TML/M2B]|uniref:FKBP-type peptidyl-prolyl cis-trans isomerase n=1 Tax=unclassified Blastococcus TaxID=2619396 RepID=UPI00190D7CF0|nr:MULTISPECIES: FKBP-type peptidyl-prolyl cis-trans isomerase [unclassified Blastococcus]MBN1091986.1 FKBP-type peptidyl-prolyl cis-trans isomerase [Blastococcus sp. TML/M2B]MBN1097912.1 FKBP-type peptidyl-prolyl cis-trans isomerase [Blastococcus sp. TML/C7B]
MSRRTASRALLAVAAAVSLVACGDSDDGSDAAASSSAEPTQQACESRPATEEPLEGVSADLAERPEVPGTDAAPPCDLVISDIVVGTGAVAETGGTAAVKYVGAFYETGEEFDSSWSRSADETIPVPLGGGRVIPGFEQGIEGMQVGGRRVVTIPSDLGYGDAGRAPIPGGATLVFVLDLVEVSP